MADDKRLGVLSQYGGGETLNELLAILEKKGLLPKVIQDYGIPGHGSYDRYPNEIRINPLKGAVEAALPHEAQHAVDAGMSKMYAGISNTPVFLRSPQEKAFFDMYQKLYVEPSKLPSANTEALGAYRGSPNEMRAHGVGNYAKEASYPITPVGNHVDATMAQEAAIMRDLYNKTQDTSPRTIQDLAPRLMNYLKYQDPMGFTIK
jgi:hypothetical protein